MHSFLHRTILNNYIDIKLSRSNLFILQLKLKKKSKSVEQMSVSSCLNSYNFDLLSKTKTSVLLKTFNFIEKALTELEINEENFLIILYYKNFFFKKKFKKLKLYLKVTHLINFFYIISSLNLIRFMKKINNKFLSSKITDIGSLNLRK